MPLNLPSVGGGKGFGPPPAIFALPLLNCTNRCCRPGSTVENNDSCCLQRWCRCGLQDRPVKAPVGRDNVPEKVQGFWGEPEELRAEWQAGYDRGIVLRRNWFKGYKAGKAGQWRDACPFSNEWGSGAEQWRRGWYVGYRRYIVSQLVPVLRGVKLEHAVREVSYPDYDHVEGVEYPGGVRYKRLTKRDLLGACVEALMGRYGNEYELPKSLEDCIKLFTENGESEWGHCAVITIKQMKQEKAQEEYERMERAAQAFAAKCGKPMGTMAFLRALDKAVNEVHYRRERWNDGETRMEEWAACMYSDAGRGTTSTAD